MMTMILSPLKAAGAAKPEGAPKPPAEKKPPALKPPAAPPKSEDGDPPPTA